MSGSRTRTYLDDYEVEDRIAVWTGSRSGAWTQTTGVIAEVVRDHSGALMYYGVEDDRGGATFIRLDEVACRLPSLNDPEGFLEWLDQDLPTPNPPPW